MTRFRDLGIQAQLAISGILLILSTTLISMGGFAYVESLTREENDTYLSDQRLADLAAYFEVQIRSINQSSRRMLANESVQRLLNENDPSLRIVLWNRARQEWGLTVEEDPLIRSVIVRDLDNDRFSIGSITGDSGGAEHRGGRVTDEILRLRGAPFYLIDELGRLSLIRIINDLETQRPIGVLQLNSQIRYLMGSRSQSTPPLRLVSMIDSDPIGVFATGTEEEWMEDIPVGETNLTLSTTRISTAIIDGSSFARTALIIILINAVFVFLGLLTTQRRFTRPIHNLTEAMSRQTGTTLITLSEDDRRDEIGALQAGYNALIRRINHSIDCLRKTENEKRKAELTVLQAQIKPHFLYNSLDAIASLAMADGSPSAHNALKSLGGFFRSSLSEGRERVSVGEEIATVRNYLAVQEIRNRGTFSLICQVQRDTEELPILKLLLQPLVENALYHGIKPQDDPGIIRISTKLTDLDLIMDVEDNGVGLDGLLPEAQWGYGLQNIHKRLQLTYGESGRLSVEGVFAEGSVARIAISREALHV